MHRLSRTRAAMKWSTNVREARRAVAVASASRLAAAIGLPPLRSNKQKRKGRKECKGRKDCGLCVHRSRASTLTGGLGLIRTRIRSPFNGFSIANNDIGVNFGGGLMGLLSEHVGVRADLRYIRSLNDDSSTNPFGQIDLSRLHYWRTSFGLVLR